MNPCSKLYKKRTVNENQKYLIIVGNFLQNKKYWMENDKGEVLLVEDDMQ